MEEDLISIIVPVYNVEPYIERCVDSIIGQTYKNIEIILVDDGSPDNCPKICDEYAKKDNRIKVIHKENDISCCKLIRCTDEGKKIEKKFDNKITQYNQMEYLKKFFKIGSQECVYYAPNKLYKKKLLEEDQYPINLTSEDVVGTY